MATGRHKFRMAPLGKRKEDAEETCQLIEASKSHEPTRFDGGGPVNKPNPPTLDTRSDRDALAFLAALKSDDVEGVERLKRFSGSFFGRDRCPALVIAAVSCGREVVTKLLNSGANPNTCDLAGRYASLVAAGSGNSECLDVLLNRGAMADIGFRKLPEIYGSDGKRSEETAKRSKLEEIRLVDEFEIPLPEKTGRTPLHEAVAACSETCVELLLKRGVAVNRKDGDGNTALHLAALPPAFESQVEEEGPKERMRGCAEALLLNGADLCSKNLSGLSALVALLKNGDRAIELLHKVFDEKIGPTKSVGDDVVVTLDFQPLCPCEEEDQIDLLYQLLESDEFNDGARQEIFRHPLLRAFVRRKWYSLSTLFYVYVFVNVLHVLSLSTFVTLAYCDVFYAFGFGWRLKTAQNGIPSSRVVLVATSTLMAINVFGLSYVLKHRYRWKPEMWRNALNCVLSVFVSWYTVYEGKFRRINGKGAEVLGTTEPLTEDETEGPLTESSTATAFDSITYSTGFPPISPAVSTPRWIVDMTTVAVFLAWLELMLLVGRFPRWSSHAFLFVTVLKNVCFLLITYTCMFLGFAFVFFLQFHTVDPVSFGDPWRSLVKTVIMMNGEFGYSDMFRQDKSNGWAPSSLPFLSRIVFLCFVVVASVALVNLMVAMAVSDTRGLTKVSSEIQFMKLAQSVVHWGYFLNSMWANQCTRRIFRRFLEGFRSIPVILVYSLKSKAFPKDLEEDIKRISKRASSGEWSFTVRGNRHRLQESVAMEHLLRDFKVSLDSMRWEISALRRLVERDGTVDSGSGAPRGGRTRSSDRARSLGRGYESVA